MSTCRLSSVIIIVLQGDYVPKSLWWLLQILSHMFHSMIFLGCPKYIYNLLFLYSDLTSRSCTVLKLFLTWECMGSLHKILYLLSSKTTSSPHLLCTISLSLLFHFLMVCFWFFPLFNVTQLQIDGSDQMFCWKSQGFLLLTPNRRGCEESHPALGWHPALMEMGLEVKYSPVLSVNKFMWWHLFRQLPLLGDCRYEFHKYECVSDLDISMFV